MAARTSSIAEQACAGQLPLRELLFHPLRGALSSYFVFFAFFFTLVFLQLFCHEKNALLLIVSSVKSTDARGNSPAAAMPLITSLNGGSKILSSRLRISTDWSFPPTC